MTQPPSLSNISAELVAHIAYRLDMPSCSRLATVSKLFHGLLNDEWMWRLFSFRDFTFAAHHHDVNKGTWHNFYRSNYPLLKNCKRGSCNSVLVFQKDKLEFFKAIHRIFYAVLPGTKVAISNAMDNHPSFILPPLMLPQPLIVTQVQISPRRQLLLGTDTGTLIIRNLAPPFVGGLLPLHLAPITFLRIYKDGLISASNGDHRIIFTSLVTWERKFYAALQGPVGCIYIFKDTLFAISQGSVVMSRFKLDKFEKDKDFSALTAPCGSQLIMRGFEEVLYVYNPAGGEIHGFKLPEMQKTFSITNLRQNNQALSMRENMHVMNGYLFVGTSSGSILVYDTHSQHCFGGFHPPAGHSFQLLSIIKQYFSLIVAKWDQDQVEIVELFPLEFSDTKTDS